MFGGHWSSASGDKKYLTCHVTSQKHVTKGVGTPHCLSLLSQVWWS